MTTRLEPTILLAAVLAACPAGAGPDPPAPREPGGATDAAGLVERVRARRVRLPIYLEPRAPGACDGVDAAALEVREDGVPLAVRHLGPRRLPAVHAILLDSSESMVERIQVVRRSALAYVEALPDDEPAMLATFDDSLILHHPLTVERQGLRERLPRLLTGHGTNLWDATLQLIRQLATRPERKVLILLTDGCDTQTAPTVSPAQVAERAGRTESLVVYPIGLRLPSRCEGAGRAEDPAVLLRGLARATGGEFFAIDSPAGMDAVLRTVRERLSRELFVSYIPPPFGEGPRDRAGERDHRWRRIELSLRGAPRCRAHVAGASVRYEGADREDSAAFFERELSAVRLTLDPASGTLRGTLTDVLRDGGPLSRPGPAGPGPWRPAGRLPPAGGVPLLQVEPGAVRIELSPGPTTGPREVVAVIPPLERVLWPGALPEYAFLDALATLTDDAPTLGLARLQGGLTAWSDAPFLVNGRTLLEYRRLLALSLADHPRYGEWAAARARETRLAELDALAGELTDDEDLRRLERVRAWVRGGDWRPEPAESARHLSAWLGDIPSARLLDAAELWLAKRLLARNSGDGRRPDEADAEETERLWHDAAAMLATADRVRLLGLLVPAHDPRRDAIGFYRIVLPRATEPFHRRHPSPEAPLGARLIGWALGHAGFAREAAAGGYETVRIDYDATEDIAPTLALVGLPRAEPDRPWAAQRVRITLAARAPPGQRVTIAALFTPRPYPGVPPAEPVCLIVPPGTGPSDDGGLRGLVRALVDAKRAGEFPCVAVGDPGSPPLGSRR